MVELKIEETSSADIPIVRSEHFQTLYINHARAGFTNWEVNMTLSRLGETVPGKPAVEEQVMILMSIDFAKALLVNLTQVIDIFEKNKKALTAEPKKE